MFVGRGLVPRRGGLRGYSDPLPVLRPLAGRGGGLAGGARQWPAGRRQSFGTEPRGAGARAGVPRTNAAVLVKVSARHCACNRLRTRRPSPHAGPAFHEKAVRCQLRRSCFPPSVTVIPSPVPTLPSALSRALWLGARWGPFPSGAAICASRSELAPPAAGQLRSRQN